MYRENGCQQGVKMDTVSSKKTMDIALYGIFTAIILIMSFTPLGYLKIGVVDISFLMIPVAIGAIILGPKGGAFLGAMFGITSFIQCFGMSPFGTALFDINPFYTAFLCLVPRILMGFLCGLIFINLRKIDKTKMISYIVSSGSAAVINTVLFVGTLILFFGKTEYIQNISGSTHIFAIVGVLVTFNAAIEIVACLIVGAAISKSLHYFIEGRLTQ